MSPHNLPPSTMPPAQPPPHCLSFIGRPDPGLLFCCWTVACFSLPIASPHGSHSAVKIVFSISGTDSLVSFSLAAELLRFFIGIPSQLLRLRRLQSNCFSFIVASPPPPSSSVGSAGFRPAGCGSTFVTGTMLGPLVLWANLSSRTSLSIMHRPSSAHYPPLLWPTTSALPTPSSSLLYGSGQIHPHAPSATSPNHAKDPTLSAVLLRFSKSTRLSGTSHQAQTDTRAHNDRHSHSSSSEIVGFSLNIRSSPPSSPNECVSSTAGSKAIHLSASPPVHHRHFSSNPNTLSPHSSCSHPHAPTSSPHTPPPPPPSPTFKEVLISSAPLPPLPFSHVPRHRSPLSSANACFKCYGTDYRHADCRNAVRCCACRRYVH